MSSIVVFAAAILHYINKHNTKLYCTVLYNTLSFNSLKEVILLACSLNIVKTLNTVYTTKAILRMLYRYKELLLFIII